MKSIYIIFSAAVVLLLLSTNLIAQESSTDGSGKNDKWLKKQDIHLKDSVTAYQDRDSAEETLEFTELSEPFTQQYDFNEMIREKMAWDKDLSPAKSHHQRYRISVGIIKVEKVMGGAMLKVKLFN